LAGVAIAIVPPLELELAFDAVLVLLVLPPLAAALELLEELLLDPHAATATAETTAARLQTSRLHLICI